MCYDISNKDSFESLDKKWKIQLDKFKALESMPIIITGCKGELTHAIDTYLIKFIKVICLLSLLGRNPINNIITISSISPSYSIRFYSILFYSFPYITNHIDLFR